MKILMGWELGAGLGHVNRLKVIADRLREDGAEITVVLQDFARADIFMAAGYPVLPGPHWPMPTNPEIRKIPTNNFADVLKIIGLSVETALQARVTAWQTLLTITGADLAVGDFSVSAGKAVLNQTLLGRGTLSPLLTTKASRSPSPSRSPNATASL